MASKTTTKRTILEIKSDLAKAYVYGNKAAIAVDQKELIALLDVILTENFPSDTPIEHMRRVTLHAGSVIDDAFNRK